MPLRGSHCYGRSSPPQHVGAAIEKLARPLKVAASEIFENGRQIIRQFRCRQLVTSLPGDQDSSCPADGRREYWSYGKTF